jgi:hypothetical protein
MSNIVKSSQLTNADTALIKPCSNLLSFGSIKFGVRTGSLSFGKFISNIIGVSTKKQMGGIDTGRVIAFVANNHTFRDSSVIGYFPDVTVREFWFTTYRGKNSIPTVINKTLPNPTGFSFLNFSPKPSYRVRMCAQLIVALLAAKKKGTSFNSVRVGKKGLLANFADNFNRVGALFCGIIHSVKPSFQGVTIPPAVTSSAGAFC